jgi:hypothetical protein
MIHFRRAMLLATGTLLLALGGLACGSEQSKEDRGVAIDPEVAVPDSAQEDELTSAQRQDQVIDEEDAQSKKKFDAVQEETQEEEEAQ